MKKVLEFIKKRLVIVLSVAIIVISLPTGWFFSTGMAKSTQDEIAGNASSALNKVRGARVTYTTPTLSPDQQPLEVQAAPNTKLTAFFADTRQRIADEGERVVARAESINKGDREPILDGIFPEPRGRAQLMTVDFTKRIVHESGDGSVYQSLLDRIEAGSPPNADALLDELVDLELRLLERAGGEPDNQQLDAIDAELVDRRLAKYRQRAQDMSIYAGLDAFYDLGSGTGGRGATARGVEIPLQEPAEPPSVHWCFRQQFVYWVIEDLVRALGEANRGPGGGLRGVDQAVVKRLESVRVMPLEEITNEAGDGDDDDDGFGGGGRGRGGGRGGNTGGAAVGGDGLVPTDLSVSITGRTTSEGNQSYDVRHAELVLIVSSQRLPVLFDALGSVNFMTVTDVQLEEIDAWEHLNEGYYYGTEHVVRATLRVESLWLRSWTKDLMPPSVRAALSIPDDEPEPDAAPGGDPGARGGGAPPPTPS